MRMIHASLCAAAKFLNIDAYHPEPPQAPQTGRQGHGRFRLAARLTSRNPFEWNPERW